LCLLMVCGCSTTYERSKVATARFMDCVPPIPASVILYSPEEAALTLGGKVYEMERQPAKKGLLFEGDGATYWNRGVEASIRTDDAIYNCADLPSPGF